MDEAWQCYQDAVKVGLEQVAQQADRAKAAEDKLAEAQAEAAALKQQLAALQAG